MTTHALGQQSPKKMMWAQSLLRPVRPAVYCTLPGALIRMLCRGQVPLLVSSRQVQMLMLLNEVLQELSPETVFLGQSVYEVL